jgi:Tol biopolymer transport system component
MSKRFRPIFAFWILALAALACDLPIPPISFPPTGATPLPPASPDPNELGTAVAATLTASVPGDVGATATDSAPTAEEPAETAVPAASLPHTLYYLGTDQEGLFQVFRVEQDGTTQQQITSEVDNVSDFDVSPVDGSVAYVANNQLLLINPDGSNRRVLVDGGILDPNNPFLNAINSPVFSRDGQTLAYGYRGLQLYSLATGTSELILENQVDDLGDGLFVPRELYSPERYSPDGTKLLITLAYYEGASSAIYDPATRSLVRLTGGERALICCDDTEWAYDSSSFYSASPIMGMFSSGLWRVDAATGAVTTLIPGDAGGGNFNVADEAYLAPDGQLYFLYATVPAPDGIITRSPLQIVRSAPDGVTGRTVLRADTFDLLNEALWAPDASLVIVAIAPSQEVYQGGEARIIYLDGRSDTVLVPYAQQMKWGP